MAMSDSRLRSLLSPQRAVRMASTECPLIICDQVRPLRGAGIPYNDEPTVLGTEQLYCFRSCHPKKSFVGSIDGPSAVVGATFNPGQPLNGQEASWSLPG